MKKKFRDLGILTVAVVTKPFSFEGHRRKTQAEEGLENLKMQHKKMHKLVVFLTGILDKTSGIKTSDSPQT